MNLGIDYSMSTWRPYINQLHVEMCRCRLFIAGRKFLISWCCWGFKGAAYRSPACFGPRLAEPFVAKPDPSAGSAICGVACRRQSAQQSAPWGWIEKFGADIKPCNIEAAIGAVFDAQIPEAELG